MDNAGFIAALRSDGAALARAAEKGLDAAVPACPGWTVADLVRHTGQVHRMRIDIVGDRLQERPGLRQAPPDAELLPWFSAGVAELAGLLEHADPATPVWTFYPPDRTVGFWIRRMAHETSVHRVDAEAAHGDAQPVAPAELAADGVAEALDVFLTRRLAGTDIGGSGETLHLHATDAPGEWLLRLHPDRVEVERGHARGDAAARGTASDLLLYLWGRVGAERLEVFGDAGVVTRVRELAALATT
jgi:uncharacterized protein (TIGR03083 family)